MCKQAHDNEDILSEEMQFELIYENVFQDDDLEFSNKVRLFIRMIKLNDLFRTQKVKMNRII
jgi:hypothetical protein